MSGGQIAGLVVIVLLALFLVALFIVSRRRDSSGAKESKSLVDWPEPRVVQDVSQSQLGSSRGTLTITTPGNGPKQRYGPFPLPVFGEPRLLVYRAADYETPMFCGAGCKRAIREGETIQEIPITSEPDGSVLFVCLLCAGKSITHH